MALLLTTYILVYQVRGWPSFQITNRWDGATKSFRTRIILGHKESQHFCTTFIFGKYSHAHPSVPLRKLQGWKSGGGRGGSMMVKGGKRSKIRQLDVLFHNWHISSFLWSWFVFVFFFTLIMDVMVRGIMRVGEMETFLLKVCFLLLRSYSLWTSLFSHIP